MLSNHEVLDGQIEYPQRPVHVNNEWWGEEMFPLKLRT